MGRPKYLSDDDNARINPNLRISRCLLRCATRSSCCNDIVNHMHVCVNVMTDNRVRWDAVGGCWSCTAVDNRRHNYTIDKQRCIRATWQRLSSYNDTDYKQNALTKSPKDGLMNRFINTVNKRAISNAINFIIIRVSKRISFRLSLPYQIDVVCTVSLH